MASVSADLESVPLRTTTSVAQSTSVSTLTSLITLLPTTTVLIFQTLSPTFTNGGTCYTSNKYLTGFLLGFCGFLCSFDSFTDSYTSTDGTLYYGIATSTGLLTMNSTINKLTKNMSAYKLTVIDFLHSLLSVLVFGAVALVDSNVVHCYYSNAGAGAKQVISNLPIGVGFVCTLLFLAFPITRHGIGYTSTSSSSSSSSSTSTST